MITIGTDLKGVFETVAGGTVPYIEVDFSGLDSKYNYGGDVFVLDMSWYVPYKPYVDSVLSAMIWLFFAWRLFIHAPGIISGASGMADFESKFGDVKQGFRNKPEPKRKR